MKDLSEKGALLVKAINEATQDIRETVTKYSEAQKPNAKWLLLEKMLLGVHTKQEFNICGIKTFYRILSISEEEDIEKKIMGYSNNAFLYACEKMKQTLALANTSAPNIPDADLSIEELNQIPFMIVELLFKEYQLFLAKHNPNPDTLTEEELEAWIEDITKKPEAWRSMPFQYLDQIMIYFVESIATLTKQRDNLVTHLSQLDTSTST